MTLVQAAEKYERTYESLSRSARRGSLKAKKVGRDWLVTDEEMERYVAEAKRGRPPEKKQDEPPGPTV